MSDNKFDLMRQAVSEAQHTMSAVDSQANNLANMLEGRLRKVQPWVLARLKKELSQFNAHTGKWKN